MRYSRALRELIAEHEREHAAGIHDWARADRILRMQRYEIDRTYRRLRNFIIIVLVAYTAFEIIWLAVRL